MSNAWHFDVLADVEARQDTAMSRCVHTIQLKMCRRLEEIIPSFISFSHVQSR